MCFYSFIFLLLLLFLELNYKNFYNQWKKLHVPFIFYFKIFAKIWQKKINVDMKISSSPFYCWCMYVFFFSLTFSLYCPEFLSYICNICPVIQDSMVCYGPFKESHFHTLKNFIYIFYYTIKINMYRYLFYILMREWNILINIQIYMRILIASRLKQKKKNYKLI